MARKCSQERCLDMASAEISEALATQLARHHELALKYYERSVSHMLSTKHGHAAAASHEETTAAPRGAE